MGPWKLSLNRIERSSTHRECQTPKGGDDQRGRRPDVLEPGGGTAVRVTVDRGAVARGLVVDLRRRVSSVLKLEASMVTWTHLTTAPSGASSVTIGGNELRGVRVYGAWVRGCPGCL